MIIYNALKYEFDQDVLSGQIADKINALFYANGIVHKNEKEYISWRNSLIYMQKVLDAPCFSDELRVAIEYQIPQTSKRVDFMLSGNDENGNSNVIIIELKQWTDAQRTSRRHIVKAFTGGQLRDVPHPSYQAYSYAMTIENFNKTVRDENISLHPCAYLHNFKSERLSQLVCNEFSDILTESPVYIKSDEEKLREFIKKYVTKPSKKNIMYEIDNGKIKPSKALQDTIGSMLKGNQEFFLIDEQKVVFETVIKKVENCLHNNQKCTLIIEGGPGTGKSVIAISLLVNLIQHGFNTQYITKNSAPRKVYFEKLKNERYGVSYIKSLFNHSGAFVYAKPNTFDCLIVDESHRLQRKTYQQGRGTIGENQIKEIINASKVSVFFIDEEQIVTAKDIGSITEIKHWANILNSEIYHDESTTLHSQFRCNGSNEYIELLDYLLGLKGDKLPFIQDLDYDFKVFDDPNEMRKILRGKNEINNKSRMLAGYCYEWISKKKEKEDLYDIELKNGFKAKWNFDNNKIWAIDKDSFEQVGCIHTSQGLEFDYVGVIIGNDLRFENGFVITDPTKRAKSDFSLKGAGKQTDFVTISDAIIRNTYKTLLTRGQKGCYVYCEDTALRDFFKQYVSIIERNRNNDVN